MAVLLGTDPLGRTSETIMSSAQETAAALHRQAGRVETAELENRVAALEASNRLLTAAVAALIMTRNRDDPEGDDDG
jgi:hypothetical protein